MWENFEMHSKERKLWYQDSGLLMWLILWSMCFLHLIVDVQLLSCCSCWIATLLRNFANSIDWKLHSLTAASLKLFLGQYPPLLISFLFDSKKYITVCNFFQRSFHFKRRTNNFFQGRLKIWWLGLKPKISLLIEDHLSDLVSNKAKETFLSWSFRN